MLDNDKGFKRKSLDADECCGCDELLLVDVVPDGIPCLSELCYIYNEYIQQ